jgi:hypothetical protein
MVLKLVSQVSSGEVNVFGGMRPTDVAGRTIAASAAGAPTGSGVFEKPRVWAPAARGAIRLYCSIFVIALLLVTGVSHAREGTDAPATAPATAPTTTAPTQPTPQADFHIDLKQTVEYLASDALEGRYVGSPGIEKAGDRIAEDFSRLGLKPVPGLQGYFQPFTMLAGATVDPGTILAVGERKLELDKDFRPSAVTGEGSFDAPVVFAGYGITDKQRNYDDYAGLDVKGKVVLVLRYEPEDEKGKSRFTKNDSWSEDATFASKLKTAGEHGVAALVFVNPPAREEEDELMPFSRMMLGSRVQVPVLQIKQAVAASMFKDGSGGDLKSVEQAIDKDLKPQSAVLKGVTVQGRVALKKNEKQVRNVVAMLPGKGDHADEYVVIGAHYDHLGRGGPGSLAPLSHEIHHGADDNASGTTAMLGIADDLSHLGPQPRTLIFIAFTGEEEGLIGSHYFVDHCPVPLDKVAYMLNLDMVGRVHGGELEIGGNGTADDLDKLIKDADEGLPLKLGTSAVGGKGGIGPSDHMSFALKKIPVLFFYSGLHRDYHRPTDTADKVNYWGMEKVVVLGDRTVEALARLQREQYVGKFDSGSMARMGGGGGHGASLGVVPDYGSSDAPPPGVRISGTSEGSAAERAGLKAGDIITTFGDMKIENLEDLSEALAKHKPGDKVHLTLLRSGKPVETDATLGERKG